MKIRRPVIDAMKWCRKIHRLTKVLYKPWTAAAHYLHDQTLKLLPKLTHHSRHQDLHLLRNTFLYEKFSKLKVTEDQVFFLWIGNFRTELLYATNDGYWIPENDWQQFWNKNRVWFGATWRFCRGMRSSSLEKHAGPIVRHRGWYRQSSSIVCFSSIIL